jgi:hypothetical protein
MSQEIAAFTVETGKALVANMNQNSLAGMTGGSFIPIPEKIRLTYPDATTGIDWHKLIAHKVVAGVVSTEWPRVAVTIAPDAMNLTGNIDVDALHADEDGWTVVGYYNGWKSVRTAEADPMADPPTEAVYEMMPCYLIPVSHCMAKPVMLYGDTPKVCLMVTATTSPDGTAELVTPVCISLDGRILPPPADYELPDPVEFNLARSGSGSVIFRFRCGILTSID